jgi:outer membrane protein OmpA-like peptidoglycan-associated protein
MLAGSVGIEKRRGRLIGRAVAALALFALGGCGSTLDAVNPINWYRDLTGKTKDDPGPDEANTANLEAGSKQPYPSVSSVPDIPTRGLSKAQRDALADGLVSDRSNARYTDAQISAGNASAVMPPQAAVPEEQTPYTPPTSDAPPPPQETARRTRLVAGGALGVVPVAVDRESTLQTPVPRGSPPPETPRAAPPPPDLAPLPPPQPDQPLPGAQPARPVPAPTEVAGIPVPPPPPTRGEPIPGAPSLSASPAIGSAAAVPPGKRTKSAQVAEVGFTAGSNDLAGDAPTKLGNVPALHQQYGGVVRIVGYAALPDSGADPAGQQLLAYQAALERANAVKKALVSAGVPAAEIVTEASPVHGKGSGADRADLYVEY